MNEEFIREIIKSTISGEPHLGTNLKEQCLMYFDNLISENKQLKKQLQQRDNIINKAREILLKEYKEDVFENYQYDLYKAVNTLRKLLGYKIERKR